MVAGGITLHQDFRAVSEGFLMAIKETRYADANELAQEAWAIADVMQVSGLYNREMMAIREELDSIAMIAVASRPLAELQEKYKDCTVLKNTNEFNG